MIITIMFYYNKGCYSAFNIDYTYMRRIEIRRKTTVFVYRTGVSPEHSLEEEECSAICWYSALLHWEPQILFLRLFASEALVVLLSRTA